MKKYNTIIFCLLFLLVPLTSDSKETSEKKITVYGNATMNVPADQARLTFMVRGTGSSLREAVANAGTKVEKVANALFSLGLKKDNLQVSKFHSGENYYDKAFLSSKRDYEAVISVIATIDDLTLLESTIFTVSEHEVKSITSIVYSLKDDSEVKEKILNMAIENAKKKASSMAGKLGMKLDKVLEIAEVQLSEPVSYKEPMILYERTMKLRKLRTESSDLVPVLPETINVEASIIASFELYGNGVE